MGIVPPEAVPWAVFAITAIAALVLIGIRNNLISIVAFVAVIAVGVAILLPVTLSDDQWSLTGLCFAGGFVVGGFIGAFIRSLTRDKE